MIGTQGVECAIAICRSSSALTPIIRLWTNTSNTEDLNIYASLEATFGDSGAWTHVVISLSGQLQRLYCDGVLVQESVFNSSIPNFDIGLLALSGGCDIICSKLKTFCSADAACSDTASLWIQTLRSGPGDRTPVSCVSARAMQGRPCSCTRRRGWVGG